MQMKWIQLVLPVLLLVEVSLSSAQDVLPPTDSMTTVSNTESTQTLSSAMTPATAYLRTNKLGYSPQEQMSVYMTTDPMGNTNSYTMFSYLENIETGERQYFAPLSGPTDLSTTIKDIHGNPEGNFLSALMPKFSKTRILTGPGPAAGLWHIVGEVRSADTTQVAKKLFAKFVVTALNQTFGAAGTDTEISVDTTWSNDTIYKIQHQVLVNSDTTLTIQPGTLILAKGQNAVLVIEKAQKLLRTGVGNCQYY